MPHHIPHNLTLLGFSPLKSSSFALFLRPFSIFASSPSSSHPSRRPRTAGYRRSDPSPRFPPRRKWSSFEEEKSRQRKGLSPMEKDKASFNPSDAFEFNKRRAEGKDKIDKPKKNLKRNSRTLNPTNTIAYVQVSIFTPKRLRLSISLGCFCFKFETLIFWFCLHFRYLEREWIHRIRHLLYCSSLTNKGSSLMLER